MTVLGADPEELESTALRVLALADNYENANQQIGYWLRRMAWEGAEADRFRALYQSQMHPQLMAAAAFSRQASSELRAQAANQIRASRNERTVSWVSGTPLLPVGGLDVPDFSGIGDQLKILLDSVSDFFDIHTFAGLLDPKLVSKAGKNIFGPIGGVISAWALITDVPELFDDVGDFGDAIARRDLGDVLEAIEQFGYSYSDIAIDFGGILLGVSPLFGPAAPVVASIGMGLLVGGWGIKAAAFAFDHLRGPVAEGLKDIYDFTRGLGTDIVNELLSFEEVGEAGREISREFSEGIREIQEADGFIETGAEVLEAGLETGAEIVEGTFEVVGEVGMKAVHGAKDLRTGIKNWVLGK